jgi:NAD(P)H-hydrate epimerase
MRYLVTAEEMKNLDRHTTEDIHIPSMVLMERAALAVCVEIMKYIKESGRAKVLIMVGMGNNGGDGLAIARLLCESGVDVSVCTAGGSSKASEQWKLQRQILQNYPVRFINNPDDLTDNEEYNIYVDAIFGVGLARNVEGIYAGIIDTVNKKDGVKIAVDVPSGVNSDDGSIMGCAFKADVTVTFSYEKIGLYLYPGCEYAGRVVLGDAGITDRGYGKNDGHNMFYYDEQLKELLPHRDASGNKGSFGKVLIIAGSMNMAGAAVLAATGCYRSGAGMVKVLTPSENRNILQSTVPEALLGTYDDYKESESWADIILTGPGIGQKKEALGILKKVVNESSKPLVLDADALNLMSADKDIYDEVSRQGQGGRDIILTPHIGELSRLEGESINVLKRQTWHYAGKLSCDMGAVVAAKDARTFVCAPDGRVCVNIRGTSGMATAGSGDVLAGCIAGLLAQTKDAFRAASVGVYACALAGEAAAREKSDYAMTAMDIAQQLMGDK